MKQDLNYKYPFLVWLTSIFIAPIFLVLVFAFTSFERREFSEMLTILIWIVLGGVIILIPAVLITQIAFKFLAQLTESSIWLRLLFSFFSIALVWLIVYFLNFQFSVHSNIFIAICYSLSTILSSMLFNIQSKK